MNRRGDASSTTGDHLLTRRSRGDRLLDSPLAAALNAACQGQQACGHLTLQLQRQ